MRQASLAQALLLLYLVCGLNAWVDLTGVPATPASERMLGIGNMTLTQLGGLQA